MMNCIFCKEDSTASRSVEHIVPESLWNTKHVLTPGVVCDACNNYFSREVEKPFLDAPAIRHLRFHQFIPNKRGKVPSVEGIISPGFRATAYREVKSQGTIIDVPEEAVPHLLKAKEGRLIFPPGGEPPSNRVIARFLAKVAIEALAQRIVPHGGHAYSVEETQLDPLRNFARRGTPYTWPHHERRIYDADRKVFEKDGQEAQTVHEYDILVTKNNEYFLVLCIFGLELTINIGGPEIQGYLNWLEEHNHVSPLYYGKNLLEPPQ